MTLQLKNVNLAGTSSTLGRSGRTSVTTQAKTNLASSSSATKTSLFSLKGVKKQNYVPGQRGSVNIAHANYSRLRASLNSSSYSYNSGYSYDNSAGTTYVSYQNGSSTWANIGLAVGIVAGGLQKFGVLNKLTGTNNTNSTNGANGTGTTNNKTLDNIVNNTNTSVDTSTYTGQLSSATSFTQLNASVQKEQQDKTQLTQSYSNLAKTTKDDVSKALNGNDTTNGFEDAGVNTSQWISKMSLSTLDCSDLENAISTADGDLSKLGDFLTNDLVSAESTVSNSLGQTEQELAAIDLSLKTETDSDKKAELESRKTKLEQKQKELKAAQEAINSIKTTCTSAKDDLTTKLDTLKDMKKFEDNVKDKKYDLAKSQDKALGEALKKVDKLNKQISKLKDKNHDKYDNSDDKRATKYNQLINERTQAYANITSLMTSLNAAGETTFVNSKNNSYSLQNLSQAMKINTSN